MVVLNKLTLPSIYSLSKVIFTEMQSNNMNMRLKYCGSIPEIPKAFLIFSPGAVETDRAIESLLYYGPSTSKRLHVTEDFKGAIAGIRGHTIHTILPLL